LAARPPCRGRTFKHHDVYLSFRCFGRGRIFSFDANRKGAGPQGRAHKSVLEVNQKMPSEKVLSEKKQIVQELSEKIKNASAGVLVEYKGITVEDDTKLRRELRGAGVEYAVVKNTLLNFAAKEAGFEALSPVLNGTTAMAISHEDQVAAAKVLSKFAETNKAIKIKAGFVDGRVIDVDEVKQLASLPGREGLLSMLLSALTGNLRGLAVALNAIAEKEGEAAPEVAAEAAPEAAPAE